MSNTTFNFENAKNAMFESMKMAFVFNFSLKNVDECINSVEAATEKFNDFLAEVNDKAEELALERANYSKTMEFFNQKKENLNGLNKLIISLNERPEYLETALRTAEDEFAEAENNLTASETKVRNLEKFFADLKPVEQVVANKVESVKVETPKQEKKDDAIVDSKAVIKFAENGGYKVVIGNGKELDCTIFQDVRNILDNLADEVFNNTFTVKYAKNRNKNSDKAFFVFFAKPNNC